MNAADWIHSASVYKKRNTMYFHSYCKTENEMLFVTGPYVALGADASAEDIANAINSTLKASKIVNCEDFIEHLLPRALIEMSGSETWLDFMKDADFCFFSRLKTEFVFMPHRRVPQLINPRFKPTGKEVKIPAYCEQDEVVKALLEALERCTRP